MLVLSHPFKMLHKLIYSTIHNMLTLASCHINWMLCLLAFSLVYVNIHKYSVS